MKHNSFGIGMENIFGQSAERGTYKAVFLFGLIYAQLLSSFICTVPTKYRTSVSCQLQLLLQIPLFTPG